MSEYKINDDWVLKRISNKSNSFNQWINDLTQTIQKSLEKTKPEVAQEFKEAQKELPDMVQMEEKIKQAQKKIEGLGSLGGYISNIASNIQSKISQQIKDSFSNIPEFVGSEIDIDFITGKRKSLSSALYDVAKERGINSEGILYLIKSLPDMESFLYSTSAGKFYRDHTEHQLRVAVLGDFLLEQDLGAGNFLNHIADLTELDKNFIKDKLWWVMGLLHDIGYPLQKMTKSINYALLNQILKCYPSLNLDVVPFEITLSTQDKNQMKYLEILEYGLSKEAKELIHIGAGVNFKEIPIPKIETFTSSSNGHSEFLYESPIELDHGIIGALSILKSLGSPSEILENKDEFDGYIKAAQAIALHNFKNKLPEYIFDNNPLAFLLVLIDEMQEWGRPVPLQIRDSYFTTELKKITLLDEVLLTIDNVEWLMAYKKMDAKKITNFQFHYFCNAKREAFNRLEKGNEFPGTIIVLQDYEIEVQESNTKLNERKLLSDLTKQLMVEDDDKKKGKLDKKELALQTRSRKMKENEESKIQLQELVSKKPERFEKLLSEFYIRI